MIGTTWYSGNGRSADADDLLLAENTTSTDDAEEAAAQVLSGVEV